MDHQYEERYVAFLDILGFSDLIERTAGATPAVALDAVVRALEIPHEVVLKDIILGRIGDISAAKHTLTAFSDCVAISTIASEQGLMNLLFHVRAILFRLLRLGFLARGGIARGLVYHREGKILGPALLEAYRLESRVAIYPRVILSPAVVEDGLTAAAPVDRVFGRMVSRNEDEHYMVESLWALRMAADSEIGFVGEWAEVVSRIRRFLADEESRLGSNPEKSKELAKVQWFRKYFESATDRSWIDELRAPFPQ